MKYTKPQGVLDAWNDHCYFTDGMKMAEFIDSLPAEFEIVEPGNVQVKWPTCAYRGAMEFSADTCDMTGHKGTAILLRALAAIAPVKKKKRRVEIWKHVSGRMEAWEVPLDPRANVFGWHRVETATPIEIDD